MVATDCASAHQREEAEGSPCSAALPCLPSLTMVLPTPPGDGTHCASPWAGSSSKTADSGGRSTAWDEVRTGQCRLYVAGKALIQSCMTHLWASRGKTWPPIAVSSLARSHLPVAWGTAPQGLAHHEEVEWGVGRGCGEAGQSTLYRVQLIPSREMGGFGAQ